MLHLLVTLLAGFSVIGLTLLLAAYLGFFESMQKSRLGIAACVALCVALAALQLEHLHHLQTGADLLGSWHYVALLFVVPPAFYFFSRDILQPGRGPLVGDVLHAVPLLASVFLPPAVVAPAAFFIGAGYSLWLAFNVYGMRRHVRRFRFEMFFFGLFALIAVGVLAMIVSAPWTGTIFFYLAYASGIGLSVVLVNAALLMFPDILSDITEVAKLSYANSTLKNVDVEQKLRELDRVMATDKLFRDEALTLTTLAEAVGLSAHQLSEVINTRFGVGFSRFVRERRIEDAKRLLREEPRASALSVGLNCGFGSQSTFYAAFKEVTGQSPAAYRKLHSKADDPPE